MVRRLSGDHQYPIGKGSRATDMGDVDMDQPVRPRRKVSEDEMDRPVRPRRKISFRPLYPSISDMPDIPLAIEVFNDYERNGTTMEEPSPREEERNAWNDATSIRNYDAPPPSRIERETSYFEETSGQLSCFEETSAQMVPPPTIERQHSYYEEPRRGNSYHEERSQQMSYGHSSMPNNSSNPIEDEHEEESKYDRSTVEIAPGKYMELRGSKETWDALQRNFSQEIDCAMCSTHIRFIRDAAMVICPVCRMILPVDSDHGFGLGLGVKVEAEQQRHCSYSMQEQYTSREAEHQFAKSSKDAKCSDTKYSSSRDEYANTTIQQREPLPIRRLSRKDNKYYGNSESSIQRERIPIRRLSRHDYQTSSRGGGWSSSGHSNY